MKNYDDYENIFLIMKILSHSNYRVWYVRIPMRTIKRR
jgi:hypothetical protein